MSLSQLLDSALALKPDLEVIYDGVRRLTYKELNLEASELASGLHQLGITKGDRVAVSLPNWHEFIVIQFALAKLGAILIPFNTRFKKEEVTYILNNSGAKVVFFPEEFDHINHFNQYQEIKENIPTLEHLVAVRFHSNEIESYENLLRAGKVKQAPKVEIDPIEDVYAILYTSGTTGKPKGAMLTHKNLVHTAVAGAECMKCSPNDVFLLPTPAFHVMGLMFVLRVIASASRMVLMEVFKPEKALALVEQEKVTIHPGVPTMFILELNHPNFSKYDLSSLRTGEMGGAPAPVEIIRRIREEMGINILIGYGMTETSPTLSLTSFDDDDLVRAETVGRPLPGVEVKVVDGNRNEVAIGEVGELACKSFGLMKGYYNMPEKTYETIDEQGWYYTGDLATIDQKGYIRIVGRKKEMIIRGGYNIYPREVEEYFYTHPYVNNVAILGLPDTVLGEISCACIQLKAGTISSEEEMLSFIKEKVADYKVPDKIVFVEDFPMTPSGKIKKIELQSQLKEQVQLR
ncbi:long-chain-fatty-acid--CoA ligase [Bacillus sp. Marseille-P3661]|uniref:long-chain-fatty-acid--CoA ligase n=1 Tax=Bacillus sp. Marseille-P3661 TaxID=1936234 RepID=UPI002155824C|nr:long-chain-fatty-acid--CoA ligase [Bacillus sp. Marseille-P3661]